MIGNTEIEKLKLVNHELVNLLSMAVLDFKLATNYFLEYKLSKQYRNLTSSEALVQISQGLQFIDEFNQRLTHIIQINQILTGEIESNKLGFSNSLRHNDKSLLGINCLQLAVVKHDYQLVSDMCFNQINYLVNQVKLSNSNTLASPLFINTNTVLYLLSQSLINLCELVNKSVLSGDELLTREHAIQLNNFYKTEKERYVSAWMLHHKSTEVNELMSSYHDDGFDRQIEEIELF